MGEPKTWQVGAVLVLLGSAGCFSVKNTEGIREYYAKDKGIYD